MIERRKDELKIFRSIYGELHHGPDLEWVIIKQLKLLSGWSKAATSVLVFIPVGYPVTPPDNFYTDNDLRLMGGMLPGNSTPNQQFLGREWLQFSFHVDGDWKPHADLLSGHNLLTFLEGVIRRLSEGS
jgi:hypothetical protein